jgi:hypothetical protein
LPEGTCDKTVFIGSPISVASAPDASNCEISAANTSGCRHLRIIPIGKLILPAAGAIIRLLVVWPVAALFAKTIRWVARVDPDLLCPPGGALGRGITIGCVVSAPATPPDADTRPERCGGFGTTPEICGGFTTTLPEGSGGLTDGAAPKGWGGLTTVAPLPESLGGLTVGTVPLLGGV